MPMRSLEHSDILHLLPQANLQHWGIFTKALARSTHCKHSHIKMLFLTTPPSNLFHPHNFPDSISIILIFYSLSIQDSLGQTTEFQATKPFAEHSVFLLNAVLLQFFGLSPVANLHLQCHLSPSALCPPTSSFLQLQLLLSSLRASASMSSFPTSLPQQYFL